MNIFTTVKYCCILHGRVFVMLLFDVINWPFIFKRQSIIKIFVSADMHQHMYVHITVVIICRGRAVTNVDRTCGPTPLLISLCNKIYMFILYYHHVVLKRKVSRPGRTFMHLYGLFKTLRLDAAAAGCENPKLSWFM